MSEEQFISEWRDRLAEGQLGVALVAPDHPLEVYAGVSDLGRPLFQIRSATKPRLPELSDLVMVDRKEVTGQWILSLILQDTRFNEVFLRLVAHLVATSRLKSSTEDAWSSIDSVLDEWKRLFRSRPIGVLSLEELRGLIGEIWLVLNRFSALMPVDQAVTGWLGPFNAPQDFWYEGLGFFESKSIGPTATHIKISSASQLDMDDMKLLVVHTRQVSETDKGALSLVSLVTELTSALDLLGLSHDELTLRLRRLGVDIAHTFYSETWFKVDVVETFAVADGFPALRQSEIPEGVDHVRYSLTRQSLVPFLTKTDLIS